MPAVARVATADVELTDVANGRGLILTRPLGATVGDFLDKPSANSGLALGRFEASAILERFRWTWNRERASGTGSFCDSSVSVLDRGWLWVVGPIRRICAAGCWRQTS